MQIARFEVDYGKIVQAYPFFLEKGAGQPGRYLYFILHANLYVQFHLRANPKIEQMKNIDEYCDNSGFMMTAQVARSIVREAELTKSYSDENLYITGILRNDNIQSNSVILSDHSSRI